MRYDLMLTGLGAVVATLALAAPVVYRLKQDQPSQIVVVDVQKLIGDEQSALLKQFNNGDPVHMTDAARDQATQHAGEYAKRLSAALDQMGAECHCVIVNKAAVLAGDAPDYTALVAGRIAK
ncbi:TrbI F-type domain-containing protein [Burkholderia glumae]|uniref:TrbI F-type domain-containing protein n=1 Tax=Burkholderia glumae TaxID=337 RepID=UPI00040479AA|nr:TrbI F-type domain-containing protein [Burkholderia glumae]QKM57776.1 hypothetical protein CG017_05856 [Burkholderia glumae]